MKKIAIHHREGSFSERWIKYCEREKIPYKVVNAFDSDIVEQLHDCKALMWHHHQSKFKDVVAAKKILFALEHSGFKVFPDSRTSWHFDDKVAQKYLFEALGISHVPSYVFYDKSNALKWVRNIKYPIVFKLKGGAGSSNVKLVRSSREAIKLVNKAFGKGFPQFDRIAYLKERIYRYRSGRDSWVGVLKGVGRLLLRTEYSKEQANDRGYVYFQDFIPNNEFDIRVIVIGSRAFAIKRYVRSNDFRASGSGLIEFSREEIDIRVIKAAFDVSDKIKPQSAAYDFVFNEFNEILLIEVSYCFAIKPYDSCVGYWDRGLNWYEGKFNPQEWMVDVVN